jgi:hypothetical protein
MENTITVAADVRTRQDRLVELTNTTLPDLKRIAAQVGIKRAQHLPKPRLINAIIAKEFPGSADGRMETLANLEHLQALVHQPLNRIAPDCKPPQSPPAEERERSPARWPSDEGRTLVDRRPGYLIRSSGVTAPGRFSASRASGGTVDTADLKSAGGDPMWVRIPPRPSPPSCLYTPFSRSSTAPLLNQKSAR